MWPAYFEDGRYWVPVPVAQVMKMALLARAEVIAAEDARVFAMLGVW